MRAGYIPQWISLLDAIKHVQRVDGVTFQEAFEALSIPLRESAISSRLRGQEIGGIAADFEGRSGAVPPGCWYSATVNADNGSVEFGSDRYYRYVAGLRLRRQIEIQRSDLLEYWPERAEATQDAAAQPATGTVEPVQPSQSSVLSAATACPSQPQCGSPNKPGSPAAFATQYIAETQAASRVPTKTGLESAWKDAGRIGHRDALRAAFDEAMGEAAPARGRPRKSPPKIAEI